MSTTISRTKTRPYRVLIVDDHALVRLGLTQLIAHENDLQVCGDAGNANEALQKIKLLQPHLVVLDISLQQGNGIELTKTLKIQFPDIKVLISSMHDETLFAERALRAGAVGYINKQEAADKVIDAIRQVMDGQVYLSVEMTSHLLHRLGNHREDLLQRPTVELLSDRECEVFELIGHGIPTREIAKRLHLSVKTIETHREHIKEKLGLTNGAELTRHAVQWVLEDS
ncbi:MAG: response regulator transcription factor [Planctomycetaceae bacterium]|nr:response regulator transcription factor [Planctomycetales bacterium]MCB9927586.1 response regulator transcription factor [Planctomycetaceae bacterium]